MRPSGAVNPLSILAIAAAVGSLYWVIFFGSKHVDNFTVKEAAEVSIGNALTYSDDLLINDILHRTNDPACGWHREDDESGQPIEMPGLGLTADNVVLDRDEPGQRIRVTIRYERDVRLMPTNSWTKMLFNVEKEGSYGPK